MSWRDTAVAPDGTHHLHNNQPLYAARFTEVLKYHAPGLAPASDASGAYHIGLTGEPAYAVRFHRTFGFYDGRAAVVAGSGWHHVLPDGSRLYTQQYAWCGNYQDGCCTIRTLAGRYLHLNLSGQPIYRERWAYAGDYRDGIAVVQANTGLHTHVDRGGQPLHDRWFLDLDVFHKGFARARDEAGWMHIDQRGQPLYARRFAAAEPFYNGQARVEGHDGSLLVIDESGTTRLILRRAFTDV